jgi:hypothetical protein
MAKEKGIKHQYMRRSSWQNGEIDEG